MLPHPLPEAGHIIVLQQQDASEGQSGRIEACDPDDLRNTSSNHLPSIGKTGRWNRCSDEIRRLGFPSSARCFTRSKPESQACTALVHREKLLYVCPEEQKTKHVLLALLYQREARKTPQRGLQRKGAVSRACGLLARMTAAFYCEREPFLRQGHILRANMLPRNWVLLCNISM